MSFLTYRSIIKAKLGDLCIINIIIIIGFSIFFTFHTIPNNFKKINNPEWHIRISAKTAIDSNLYQYRVLDELRDEYNWVQQGVQFFF